MKLYLAGPMRGKPKFNFPAFAEAAGKLRALEHEIISPHELDLEAGLDGNAEERPFVEYMRRDLPALLACEGVALLPGWSASRGARLEVCVAQACDLPVFYFNGFMLKPETVHIIPAPQPFAASRQDASRT